MEDNRISTDLVPASESGALDETTWPLPESKPYPKWLVVLLSSTFAWAFLVTNVAFKKIAGWNQWVTLFAYPMFCWIAAAFLFRVKKGGSTLFAMTHILLGVAWIFFVVWIAREFARNFWR